MGRLFGRSMFCSLVACALAFAAHAANFEIRYAEPVYLSLPATRGAQKITVHTSTSFRAYGRTFELGLERNDEVLASLPSAQHAQFDRYKLYRGALNGIAGSWVRLTSNGDELYGAIWDGAELYTIAPARTAIPYLTSRQSLKPSGNVVYRLSDIDTGLEAGYCAADIQRTAESGKPSDVYTRLRKDLQALAIQQVAIPKQIDIALIGDSLLSGLLGSNAQFEMVSRLNFVDGIYMNQLGVHVVASEIEIFDAQSQPFANTTNPNRALDEFGTFRVNTSAVASRGLAHLMTGRDLDGDVAGIAYISGVCQAHDGVSISEGWHPFTTSSLIAAHEIGHNFGAPHDGDSTHACGAEPLTYLMSPTLNGSSTFSNCSVTQIQATLATAACVVPASIPDVTIAGLPANAEVAGGGTIDLSATIVSDGNASIHEVAVYASTNNATFVDVTADGGSCTTQSASASCTFPVLAAGESRALHFKVRGSAVGQASLSVTAASVEDKVSGNNTQATQLSVYSPGEVTVIATPNPLSGFTRHPLDFTVNVTSNGRDALDTATATIDAGGMTPVSATTAGGTCAINGEVITCAFGSIPVGESRQVAVELVTNYQSFTAALVTVSAANLSDVPRGMLTVPLNVRASKDVSGSLSFGNGFAQVDTPFPVVLTAQSVGPELVNAAQLSITLPSGFVLDSFTSSQGTCSVAQAQVSCDVGDLAPGATATETLMVHTANIGGWTFFATTSALVDDNMSNNNVAALASVRYGIDVSANGGVPSTTYESIPFPVTMDFRSAGALTAGPVQVSVNVPAGVTVQSAAMNDQSPCTIGAQTVSCTIASITPDQIVRLTLSAATSQLGHYDFAFSVSTPGDANAVNDSGLVSTTVQPYVDPRLSASVPVVNLDVGGTGTLTYVVTAPNRDAADVNFVISVGPPDFQLVSVVTDLGTCDTSTSTVMCHLGTVPADTPASIALTVRANRRTDAAFTATIYSSADLNAGNNQAYVDVHARQHGDATVAFATASATGTPSQAVALPTLTWSALPSIDDVTLEIDTHSPTLTLSLRGTGVFPCIGLFTSKLTCNVSSLTSNSPQSYDLQVQSSGTASGTVTAQVTSANDTNADDNDASVSVVITSVNSSAPPTKSSGGGGGASDLLLLVGLALFYGRRRAALSRSAG